MPILQCLGKALLDGGAAAEAEAVYRNDLRVYPENGWGLTGLAQAMEAQGKPAADVAAVRARLAEAWSAADVPLPPSSCAAFEFDVPLPARASSPSCTAGATIAHSNITAAAPCVGAEGDECTFACDAGFVRVGRHACQSYTTKSGVAVLDREWFGGRCERLCPGSAAPCPAGTVPVRANDTVAGCFDTTCLAPDAALRRLARGAYAVWRKGRHAATGIYSGSVDPSAPASQQSDQAHIGINGVGLMFECVAAELGWITTAEAAARVNLTLTALAGELPGFALARQARHGWIPTFVNRTTGAALGHQQPYTVLDSGLNSAGVLFARTYFAAAAAAAALPAALGASVARLAKKVFNLVRFEHLLCSGASGQQDDGGAGIPFTLDDDGACGAVHLPRDDGYYDFNEVHYTVWLAHQRACAPGAGGNCTAQLKDMWAAWQGRRQHPDLSYHGHALLSDWPSYIVQLPYYAAHSFNADATWTSLFASHWAADWAYYNTSAYYGGDDGRYGLAAGPTDKWCSAKDSGYEADMLAGDGAKAGAQGCRLYSPFAVAGYLPAAPDTIRGHLLALLAAGESVFRMDGEFHAGDFVLLRRSMLEPGGWDQTTHVTMVDFSSELFGLSTLWLGDGFYQTHTDHDWADLNAPDDYQDDGDGGALAAAPFSSSPFDAADTNRTLHLAYAAFCNASAVAAWDCQWCVGPGAYAEPLEMSAYLKDDKAGTQGYIAIDRVRQRVVVAYRGSKNLANDIEDADFFLTQLPFGPEGLKVDSGFLAAYKSVRDATVSGVQAALSKCGGGCSVLFTGHSLGAAMATLGAAELGGGGGGGGGSDESPAVRLVTFGSPRVGDPAFAAWAHARLQNASGVGSLRLRRQKDIVTAIPPRSVGYAHLAGEVWDKHLDAGGKQTYDSFVACDGSGEDPHCGDSEEHPPFPLDLLHLSSAEHTRYFGFQGGNCWCGTANCK